MTKISVVEACGLYTRRDLIKQGSLLLAGTQMAVFATGAAADVSSSEETRSAVYVASRSDPLFVEAQTSYGKIRGYRIDGINEFRGVPYGASTAGANRFMPPRKPAPWKDVLDTLGVGSRAPQIRRPGIDYLMSFDWDQQPGAMGEDCLNLSIWTPGIRDGATRPVLVSLHGGGFTQGSGNAGIYAGDRLARFGDVVVVSPNHRLNVFGFLYLAGVGAPPEFEQAGVAGMLDLVQVLEWVRDNAESFGGDPNNVTIRGDSGGGMKVSTLMAMPAAQGLFHRAIVQSGSTGGALRLAEPQESADFAAKLLAELGISKRRIADLQQIHFAHILESRTFSGMGIGRGAIGRPVVDGKFVLQQPFGPTAPAISAHVPMIVGTTLDDGAHELVTYSKPGPYTAQLQNGRLDHAGLEEFARQSLGAKADTVLAAYRQAYPTAAPFFIYARILTDRGFRRNAFAQVESKAAQKAAPVWMYRFDYPSPAYGGKWGAIHGTDVEYTFHSHRHVFTGGSASERDEQIAKMMASTWVAFARTGDPNNSTVPKWSAYDTARREVMLFNFEPRAVSNPDARLREFAQQESGEMKST